MNDGDAVAPSNFSKSMEKLMQPFPCFSNDLTNVHSRAHDDNLSSSNSSKPKEKTEQTFLSFSNDSFNVHCGAHDDNLAPLNYSKLKEKIKRPFLGFSNDFNNVHSGGHNKNVVPSNSTMTTTIVSSSNNSTKVDPCKPSIIFLSFILICCFFVNLDHRGFNYIKIGLSHFIWMSFFASIFFWDESQGKKSDVLDNAYHLY